MSPLELIQIPNLRLRQFRQIVVLSSLLIAINSEAFEFEFIPLNDPGVPQEPGYTKVALHFKRTSEAPWEILPAKGEPSIESLTTRKPLDSHLLEFLLLHGVPQEELPRIQALTAKDGILLSSSLPGPPIEQLDPRDGRTTERLLPFMTPITESARTSLLDSLGKGNPSEIIRDMKRGFPTLGKLFESANTTRGTISSHTREVLHTFEVQKQHLPPGTFERLSHAGIRFDLLMRAALALHDIGKPFNRRAQSSFNEPLLQHALVQIGFSPREVFFALAVARNPIGPLVEARSTNPVELVATGKAMAPKFLDAAARISAQSPQTKAAQVHPLLAQDLFSVSRAFYVSDTYFYERFRGKAVTLQKSGEITVSGSYEKGPGVEALLAEIQHSEKAPPMHSARGEGVPQEAASHHRSKEAGESSHHWWKRS